MRKLFGLVVMGTWVGGVWAAELGTQPTVQAQTEAAKPVIKIGSPELSGWSATTKDAAGSQAIEGTRMTVTGEVVDVSCYLELGKRGVKHKACGTECIRAGQPAGILDDKGMLYVVFPEEHMPRRKGETSGLRDQLSVHVAETVTVTGMHSLVGGTHTLFVRTLEEKAVPEPAAPEKK